MSHLITRKVILVFFSCFLFLFAFVSCGPGVGNIINEEEDETGSLGGPGGSSGEDTPAPDAPVVLGETLTINNAQVYSSLGSMPGNELDPLLTPALPTSTTNSSKPR